MGLQGRVVAGLRWSALSSGMLGIIGLLQLIVLARILGPAAMGLMAMAMILVDFGGKFSDLGLTEAVIQRENPSQGALSSLYWLMVGFATLAAAVIAVLGPIAGKPFGPEVVAMIPVVALKIWIIGLGSQFKALLKKRLGLHLLAAADIAGALAGFTVAMLSVLVFQQGVWALVWGVLANAIVQSAIYQAWGWSQPDRPRLYFSYPEIKSYLGFGMYRTGASLVSFINSRADQALIGGLMGPQALGFYNVAFTIAKQPISRVFPIATRVAFPAFSIVQQDRERLRAGYLKLIGGLMFLLAPLFVGIAAVAPVAVPYFLGNDWAPSVPAVQILVFAALISCVISASETLVNATGSAQWSLYLQIALLLLVPPVVLIAAGTGSIAIVSLALLLLKATTFGAGYVLKIRRIVGPCLTDLGRVAGVPLLLSMMMGIAVSLGVPVLQGFSVVFQLSTLVAGGAIVYLLVVMLFQRRVLEENLALVLMPGSRSHRAKKLSSTGPPL